MTIRPPSQTEWDTSRMGRTYLDASLHFEEMAARAADLAAILGGKIEPYRNRAPEDDPKARRARQAILVAKIDHKTCDLLFNAPDGLRGRYWQSPEHGFLATRHLILNLLPKLLAFAEQNTLEIIDKAEPMTLDEVRASLELPSAKVWPVENWEIDALLVKRWVENEKDAPSKDMWRRSPIGDSIEIKGALLGKDNMEYVPKHKRHRSCQIFHYGYT